MSITQPSRNGEFHPTEKGAAGASSIEAPYADPTFVPDHIAERRSDREIDRILTILDELQIGKEETR